MYAELFGREELKPTFDFGYCIEVDDDDDDEKIVPTPPPPELVREGELGLDFPDAFDVEVEEADVPPNNKLVYELGRTIVWRFTNLDGLICADRLKN